MANGVMQLNARSPQHQQQLKLKVEAEVVLLSLSPSSCFVVVQFNLKPLSGEQQPSQGSLQWKVKALNRWPINTHLLQSDAALSWRSDQLSKENFSPTATHCLPVRSAESECLSDCLSVGLDGCADA